MRNGANVPRVVLERIMLGYLKDSRDDESLEGFPLHMSRLIGIKQDGELDAVSLQSVFNALGAAFNWREYFCKPYQSESPDAELQRFMKNWLLRAYRFVAVGGQCSEEVVFDCKTVGSVVEGAVLQGLFSKGGPLSGCDSKDTREIALERWEESKSLHAAIDLYSANVNEVDEMPGARFARLA